jgi:hypothetical protein
MLSFICITLIISVVMYEGLFENISFICIVLCINEIHLKV